MKCQVLLFAQLRDALGCDRMILELRDAATVSDALAELSARHAPIHDVRDKLAVAVNEQYARPSLALKDGDILALIPPVSGG